MHKLFVSTLCLGLGLSLGGPSPAEAGHPRGVRFAAPLSGLQEVPALITDGFGRATFEVFANRIEYRLVIGALEAPVRFAHIHIGQRGANGGVAVFLCDNTGNPGAPSGTPACPQQGVVRGTLTAAEVIGPAGQGVDPGELDALLEAIFAGVTYVNVHSDKFPAGELRGQIEERRRRGRRDRDDD